MNYEIKKSYCPSIGCLIHLLARCSKVRYFRGHTNNSGNNVHLRISQRSLNQAFGNSRLLDLSVARKATHNLRCCPLLAKETRPTMLLLYNCGLLVPLMQPLSKNKWKNSSLQRIRHVCSNYEALQR